MPKRTKKPEQIDEAVAGAAVADIRDARTVKDSEGNVTKAPTLAGLDAKPKRAKQGELAGIEASSHPELDVLMEEAATLGETMGAARQRMGEVNAQLEQEAEKLGVTTYRHPTAVPTLTLTVSEGATKVKVKKAKGDESEAEE